MFERILELFFHAKAGALAGLILVGTTGALVTATVSSANNVTTITLTQASPTGSASPSVSPATRAASPSPTVKPASSPSSSPATAAAALATTTCTADAHAMSDAVHTVNAAFSKYHTDLTHMRNEPKSDAAKKIVEDTDKLLKTLRQNAVKEIHATSACAKAESDDEDATEQEDKDTDENDDNDKDKSEKSSKKSSESNFVVILFNNLFGKNTTNTTTTNTTTTTTTTAGDPKAIADAAVAAMKLAFDDAAAKLQALPTASPKATKAPHVTSTTKGKDSHGKGSERSDHEDDDD